VEAGEMGDSKLSPKALSVMFGIANGYVSQARALLERDPPAAEGVKRGDLALAVAHEALRKREGKTKGAAAASLLRA